MRILTTNGRPGTLVQRIVSDSGSEKLLIRLEDGTYVVAGPDALLHRDDGVLMLSLDADLVRIGSPLRLEDGEQIVMPLVEEQLQVEKRSVARGRVQVRKRVVEREEVVDEPLLHQEVTVDRVPVDELIEGEPPPIRMDGDVLIIPVFEEVLVVEKRLLLREELRIVRHQSTVSRPQTHVVRKEVVDIERVQEM